MCDALIFVQGLNSGNTPVENPAVVHDPPVVHDAEHVKLRLVVVFRGFC